MISYMIFSIYVISSMTCCCSLAAAERADANDGGHERDADLDRPMDSDEERDFADQGPLTNTDMEEDAQILATLLKHIPSCMSAADIEQLLQDIPVQPSVVVPVRTVQEAVAAGDLPPLSFELAQFRVGQGTVLISIVLYIDVVHQALDPHPAHIQ